MSILSIITSVESLIAAAEAHKAEFGSMTPKASAVSLAIVDVKTALADHEAAQQSSGDAPDWFSQFYNHYVEKAAPVLEALEPLAKMIAVMNPNTAFFAEVMAAMEPVAQKYVAENEPGAPAPAVPVPEPVADDKVIGG